MCASRVESSHGVVQRELGLVTGIRDDRSEPAHGERSVRPLLVRWRELHSIGFVEHDLDGLPESPPVVHEETHAALVTKQPFDSCPQLGILVAEKRLRGERNVLRVLSIEYLEERLAKLRMLPIRRVNDERRREVEAIFVPPPPRRSGGKLRRSTIRSAKGSSSALHGDSALTQRSVASPRTARATVPRSKVRRRLPMDFEVFMSFAEFLEEVSCRGHDRRLPPDMASDRRGSAPFCLQTQTARRYTAIPSGDRIAPSSLSSAFHHCS